MADNETTADIIAEKRRRADELEASSYRPHQFLRERIAELRQEADRLEAAWKRDTKELRVEIERLKEERNYSGVRERERLRAKGFAIVPKEQLERGDAAKLREALKRIVAASIVAKNANAPEWILQRMADVFAMATTALSAPPRNCDVGTVKEQSQRFDSFCDAHKYVGDDGANWCSSTCPCYNDINCGVNWAQMPCEEGGAK